MEGKLKRMKPKLAAAIDLDPHEGEYQGDRVYARVEAEDRLKARGMKEGVDRFCQEHPKYGEILTQMIEEERSEREVHLYFGTNAGTHLTADDYMSVMQNLGFNEATARSLYQELMDVSRKISKKRDEERSILLSE
jgi:hypothetical protein